MTASRRMNLATIARAGAARAAALERADEKLDAIAEEVVAAGELGNVKLAAQTARVDRTVLSRRVHRRRLEANGRAA